MEQLAKAAAAIEAGNMSEAHVLLAQAIKADPNDVDAWLLLSQTAGSAEQKKTFLKRALIVDPDNETARQRLAELDVSVEPAPVVTAADESPAEEPPQAEDAGRVAPTDAAIPQVAGIEEPVTPPSLELADTIIVGAPEVTLVPASTPAETVAEPNAIAPIETFADPFDFDSQEEEVPDWLLGEVVAAEAVAETAAESAASDAGEDTMLVEEKPATITAEVKEEPAPTPQPAAAAAPAQAVGKAEAKKPARPSAEWLEWVIAALVLLLFLTIIFLIAG